MSLNYTKKTIQNFLKPKNIGQIDNPDALASVGNPVCGDQLSFSIRVKGDRITDIKFLSFGCASNIATASVLTQQVKGMTIAEAKKYDWQKIVATLGGLPPQKVHCSMMAIEALQRVLAAYEKRLSLAVEKKLTITKTTKKKLSPKTVTSKQK